MTVKVFNFRCCQKDCPNHADKLVVFMYGGKEPAFFQLECDEHIEFRRQNGIFGGEAYIVPIENFAPLSWRMLYSWEEMKSRALQHFDGKVK